MSDPRPQLSGTAPQGAGDLSVNGGGAAPQGAAPIFEARAIEVRLGGKRVLGPLDLDIAAGSFLGVLGPNGSGKTTLFRALTGGVDPAGGTLKCEGRPLADYRSTELARLVGVVPQTFNLDFSFTVAEMVSMGRYAHGDEAADAPAVADALETTGLVALADRLVTELSGGERQRALIAQTLAQQTPTLLLDEPLNNLDLNHQLEVMELLRSLHEEGRTIAVVLHDLNMAAHYCDELILLDGGRLIARGKPETILDPTLIMEVFRVRVAVHRQGKRPYITPLWTHREEQPVGERLRVHVIAGGGAASELLDELAVRGFSPTVGVVSVFDTDYATAQRYGLEVVSAPPFQPFPDEALREHATLVERAEAIIVAPIFFGAGNLGLLRETLHAAEAGKRVIVLAEPSIEQRDLSEGEATELVARLAAAGAVMAESSGEVLESLSAGWM